MGIARCSTPIAGGRCGLDPGHAGGHESSGLLQSRSGRDVAPGCPRCPHDAFDNQPVTDNCILKTYPVRNPLPFPEPLPGERGYKPTSAAPAHEYDPPPSHYEGGGIMPWNVIDAWGLDYYLGNVTKYICRAGKKGTATRLDDLVKARNFINKAIELEENK